MNWCWTLADTLFCIYWGDNIVFSFNVLIWFMILMSTQIGCDAMIFYILLDSICCVFFLSFTLIFIVRLLCNILKISYNKLKSISSFSILMKNLYKMIRITLFLESFNCGIIFKYWLSFLNDYRVVQVFMSFLVIHILPLLFCASFQIFLIF